MGMFDLSNSTLRPSVNKEYLLLHYGCDAIYYAFYNEYRLGTCNSPFRVDNSPSFSFFLGDNGMVYWRDAKTNEKGDVFKFADLMFQKQGKRYGFVELMGAIDEVLQGKDIPKLDRSTLEVSEGGITIPRKRDKLIQVIKSPGPMPDFAQDYWERRQRIPYPIVEAYNCYLADEVWIEILDKTTREYKMVLWGESTKDDPIFAYYFPRTGHWKCYRPLTKNKKKKWISNIRKETDVQGYDQLHLKERRPAVILLTKSMKDVMLMRANGFDAIAAHGESHVFSEDFIRHLRKYAGMLISCYDNDFAGMRGGIIHRRLYEIPDYYIPREEGAKDLSGLQELDYMAFQGAIYYVMNDLKIKYGITNFAPGSIRAAQV